VLHWLERPGSQYFNGRPKMRRVYTEEQLYWGAVRMLTRRSRPARRPVQGTEAEDDLP
jgi:hypothetical protein